MKTTSKLAYRALGAVVSSPINRLANLRVDKPNVASQIQLRMSYQAAAKAGHLQRLDEVGFSVFSDTDEDGILLYIFALVGTGPKLAVELCAGSGLECNAANLIVNHGWHALLVDGEPEKVRMGKTYFANAHGTRAFPPVFLNAWVTRDNVNDLLRAHEFTGEIDLFSLDMDGVDYHIWEALNVVEPRVVVVEYNNILGPDRAITVPYQDDFDGYAISQTNGMPNYFGASLPAFVKLARKKGYRLVGTNRLGYNAFFVRNDLATDLLPEISVHDCFQNPKTRWDMKHRYPLVRDMRWIDV